MRIVVDYDNYFVAGSLLEYVECEHGNCQEYTGIIPVGFSSYEDWFINCDCRNAYKLVNGNLVLDTDRLAELQVKINQETIDNTPLLRKDLYGTNEVLDSQYQKTTATGKVLTLSNVKNIAPSVILTNINCYAYNKINLIATGNNMLPNEATTKTINGVRFIKNTNGSISINGTATEDIEYNIAGASTNTSPFLVFKKGLNYYLSCGYTLKMFNYDGTDRTQVYSDTGGLINFADGDKKITQVILSIPKGTTINNATISPMLNLGTTAGKYEMSKINTLEIDFSSLVDEGLFPSNTLYPSDDLYPMGTTIDYIFIANGTIYIFKNGGLIPFKAGNLQLLNGDNIVHASENINIEIEYSTNTLTVEEVFNSKITKTEEEINLSVDKKLTNYSTTEEMNSAINIASNKINLEVEKKVNEEDFTGANIMLAINNDSSSAIINADKISLNGKTINLTSDNTVIKSTNFNVDKNGNMSCNNANVTGGKIKLSGGTSENDTQFIIDSTDGRRTYMLPYFLSVRGTELNQGISLQVGTETNKLARSHLSVAYDENNYIGISATSSSTTISLHGNGGYTQLNNYGITTPTVTQTSLESIKKNFEEVENATSIVKNSEIYKYNFKTEEDTDKKHYGFVIGENFNTPDEVISKTGDGIDTYSMCSILWKAVQEQQNQIELLQKEINKLKGE